MSPPTSTKSDPPQDSRQRLLAFAFGVYKATLSPLLHTIAPSRCLYLPTCSEYAYVAISRFGFVRGSWLAARRFARCHPWGKGGLDPVPLRNLAQSPPRDGPNPADHLS